MNNNGIIKSIALAFLAIFSVSCKDGKDVNAYISLASFEDGEKSLVFHPGNDVLTLSIVDNPVVCEANSSGKCMSMLTGAGEGEFIWSEPYGRNFDFTANPAVFKMKVLAPGKGLRVWMKLEPAILDGKVRPVTVRNVTTSKSGEWEELTFDFTDQFPESNVYSKIVLTFNPWHSSLDTRWYFDEIKGPDDDLTEISLFKRYEGNPVFYPEGEMNWRDSHIANAGILAPHESPDGNWWLYCRGTGYIPDYHDQIGLYTQPADDFHPFGPWNEYEGNPVIKYTEGGWDDFLLLDTAPVLGPDGTVYVYYKGRSHKMDSHIGVAYSTDGGYTFSKPGRPWIKAHSGTGSAIYHDGKYYLFSGPRVYISDDPLCGDNAEVYNTISCGGAPAHFDDYSLWGTMVWRLEGVEKWFMTYQGSSSKKDFPDRFHVAISDDLVHWEKVQNSQPLFGRGKAGEWDQGGMWCPEVFEYKDTLYMYYEGWGIDRRVKDRNADYFDGHSSIGAASCPKSDFLKWCGLE